MTDSSREPVNILIVDDHPENLLAMAATLESLHENLVSVDNGRDALRHLLMDEFACVLLDVQMADIDGFETAALIRERELTRSTPIIFLTAIHRNDVQMLRGYSIGAVDYLFKPIDPDILRSKVAVFVDIYRKSRDIERQAEQLRVSQQLMHARQMADMEEEGRRMREQHVRNNAFLADMAHELRTPLNAILGFADLLQNAPNDLTEESRRLYLNHIVSGASHLLHLVEETLNLVRTASGKLEFVPQRFNIQDLVVQVLEVLGSLIEQKRMHVSHFVDPSIREVYLDPSKLRQVLFNYLSNALKFTPDAGKVSLRIEPFGRDCFRLEVADSGIGIRASDLGSVFREFQRLQPASGTAGTGLGLALTRRLVEAQGGHVGVESEAGVGSRFYAVLPIDASVREADKGGRGGGQGAAQPMVTGDQESGAGDRVRASER